MGRRIAETEAAVMGETAVPPVPEAPPPELRYRRRVGLVRAIRELWYSRELLRSVAERELRVRYKQAFLGFAWALATPLLLMVAFTVFFQRIADVDTGGAPYALFAYLGLLPWTFFSSSVSLGGMSLVNNVPLLNKVYCPREVFPMGSVGVAVIDLVASLPALVAVFLITGFTPRLAGLWFPVLLSIALVFTVAIAMLTAAVMVYLRDLRHALPVLLQLGLFATPVAFGLDAVPRSAQTAYVIVNPLAAVIDALRTTVLLGDAPDPARVGPAAVSALLYLATAYVVFKRLETGFADVA